jgi:hypothetical protein
MPIRPVYMLLRHDHSLLFSGAGLLERRPLNIRHVLRLC